MLKPQNQHTKYTLITLAIMEKKRMYIVYIQQC